MAMSEFEKYLEAKRKEHFKEFLKKFGDAINSLSDIDIKILDKANHHGFWLLKRKTNEFNEEFHIKRGSK